MLTALRQRLVVVLAAALCLFTLAEVNYPQLLPHTQLAIFAMLGLMLCYLSFPAIKRHHEASWSQILDLSMATGVAVVCVYVIVQTQPAFEGWWLGGTNLGNRAGSEQPMDYAMAIAGLVLVLEAARRAIGWALPILSLTFLGYGLFGSAMPDWLFPHRGYDLERIVSQTFLHSQGVFGTALKVMFTYVFLFVVFGALLEVTGATRFIIDYARKLLGNTAGGPAKVSILASGLMGSLSGSAVANTATTGTFTIPLMRSSGFRRHDAAGIEAAASSGGALVPPVMGAGAYMMLEIIDPPVTYLQIVQSALLPAVLYYLSLFLIADFTARRIQARGPIKSDELEPNEAAEDDAQGGNAPDGDAQDGDAQGNTNLDNPPGKFEGLIFFASLGSLLLFLFAGFTVFRSVSLAMIVTLVLAALNPRTRPSPARLLTALKKAARAGVPLVAAASSVGIVLGIVTLTGVGSKLPATLLPLAQESLLLALLLLMASSIVLGMGLPSAVCYLLLATLVGPALSGLGVVPLAAHLFIFYFGLMSMVTPPVALAAYTAASIAGSGIMRTAFAAFRFAAVGFALPFLFVYRPQLLMLAPDGGAAPAIAIAMAFLLTAVGIVPLAGAVAGHFIGRVSMLWRCALLLLALTIFAPTAALHPAVPVSGVNLIGVVALGLVAALRWRQHKQA